MAYFANGDEGDFYEERYCSRCVHGRGDRICAVVWLHLQWNYQQRDMAQDQSAEAITKKAALDTLWPTGEDGFPTQCAMFHQAPAEAIIVHFRPGQEPVAACGMPLDSDRDWGYDPRDCDCENCKATDAYIGNVTNKRKG